MTRERFRLTEPQMLETDLYQPVKDYLESHGYEVHAEVKHCDVAAMKDDELVVVELKRTANMRLLVQATERQKVADAVYVALPEPARRNLHFRGIERVLKRLELGLLTVRFTPTGTSVRKEFDPAPRAKRSNRRRRQAVIHEISQRSGDYNVAGSSRKPLLTAYRENAIFVACCLERLGPLSPKQLRAMGSGEKTLGILSKNYYGWFERVDRALYGVSPRGRQEIRRYPEVRNRSLERIRNRPAT